MRYFKLIMILFMTFNVRPCISCCKISISKHSGIKYYLDNFSLCCLPCVQNEKYCRVFRHRMNRLINSKMKEKERKKRRKVIIFRVFIFALWNRKELAICFETIFLKLRI